MPCVSASLATDPSFLTKNKLPPINYPGPQQPCAWESNMVKSAGAKWTAHLQLNTSVYRSVSAPMTTHTEQVKTPGSTLSPMQSRLLLMPDHTQQRNRRLSRKQSQLNAPSRLHHSRRICPPIPPIPWPTRCLIQCTRLRC